MDVTIRANVEACIIQTAYFSKQAIEVNVKLGDTSDTVA